VVDSGRWRSGLLDPRELGEGWSVVKPRVNRWAMVCWVRERERERDGETASWELAEGQCGLEGAGPSFGERERQRARSQPRNGAGQRAPAGRWGRGRWPERVRFGKMGEKIGQ
jgi:hypothetical protein